MPRRLPLLILCLVCILCHSHTFSSTPGVLFAAAQGSTTTGNGFRVCTFTNWMTTQAPTIGFDVVYPSNSIAYTRHNHPLPPEAFFIAHWYVGIIIIVLLVGGAYILLGLWMCYHFKFMDQRKAKAVVVKAYATKGFFDINRYLRRHGIKGGDASRGTEMQMSRSQSFVAGGPFDGESCNESYSDDYGSRSPTPTDEDDGVIEMNPLQREAL
ncbi:hypothetical protein ABL78_0212 [Leptomonas seymouri]|uniref:Uncharacterized protein n=1 Tax=Leptomonas seymouri TaxID=5684 RepID=A0A0N0P923_LEPSE|nr:hypothetical protein ABL78_0212 [Leptomonas seymouri]|eukprot:KPI90616.1 hypothetical protein ABL78_0212 [Leptomonas seymouri]